MPPTLHELTAREIPVSWHSFGGWFLGHSIGTGHKNVELRAAQCRTSFDAAACLRIAKGLVVAKIHNQCTLLLGNWKLDASPEIIIDSFLQDMRRAQRAGDLPELLELQARLLARHLLGELAENLNFTTR